MIFQKYNYRYKYNTSFLCVLTGETIHVIVLIIRGHCQGQKVNFKVKCENIELKKCNQVYLKKLLSDLGVEIALSHRHVEFFW